MDAVPAPAHGPFPVVCGFYPVGQARILMGHRYANGTVRLINGTVLVDAYPVMAVIQGLHPVIVQLKIPGITFRGGYLDQ